MALVDDDVEEVEESDRETSSNDSEEKEHIVKHRNDREPASSDEGDGDGDGNDDDDGEDDDDEGSDDEDVGDIAMPTIRRPTNPIHRGPTNYFRGGMTETVKWLRREDPYNGPKSAQEYRFWTSF